MTTITVKNLTSEQRQVLFHLTPADVRMVYSGKPGCMCGCRGSYAYTTAAREEGTRERGYEVTDSDISDITVTRLLKKLQRVETIEQMGCDLEDETRIANFFLETETRVYVITLCKDAGRMMDEKTALVFHKAVLLMHNGDVEQLSEQTVPYLLQRVSLRLANHPVDEVILISTKKDTNGTTRREGKLQLSAAMAKLHCDRLLSK